MRILHVINAIGLREGAELSLIDILVSTASDEFDHTVAVLRHDDPEVPELEEAGVPVQRPPVALRSRASQVVYVRDVMRSVDPDLVHSSLFDADLAARIAGRLVGKPVLTSLVNMPYTEEAFAAELVPAWKLHAVRRLDGLLARRLTIGFHAISHAVAAHAVSHLGVDRARIRVVPRGRSVAKLGTRDPDRRARVRSELGWCDRPVVLNAARQEPQKGQIYLVEAMPRVLEAVPDTIAVVAGREGRSSGYLRRRIGELGLDEHVLLLGVRDDVPDLMAAADVFAFPSLFEGLGGAVVEAMGLELPVVSFNTPAVSEALASGDCGRLVPTAEVRPFADAIVELLRERDRAGALAQAARKRFLEHYELGPSIEGMRSLYRDVAGALPVGRSEHLHLWIDK